MGILRTSEIFNDSVLRVIVVESVDFRHTKTNTFCQVSGHIKPIAVIVRNPDGAYALNMEAKPTDLDQLRQDIPELDAIVALTDKG